MWREMRNATELFTLACFSELQVIVFINVSNNTRTKKFYFGRTGIVPIVGLIVDIRS